MRQGFPLEFRHGPTFRRDKKRFPTDGIVESRCAVLVFELREKVDLAWCHRRWVSSRAVQHGHSAPCTCTKRVSEVRHPAEKTARLGIVLVVAANVVGHAARLSRFGEPEGITVDLPR